jgi:hypothetical protein
LKQLCARADGADKRNDYDLRWTPRYAQDQIPMTENSPAEGRMRRFITSQFPFLHARRGNQKPYLSVLGLALAANTP